MDLFEEKIKTESNAMHYFITLSLVVLSFITIGYLPLIISLSLSTNDPSKYIDNTMIAELIGSNSFFAVILFPFVVVLLSLIIGVKFVHKKTVLSLFTSRDSFDWKRFGFSFLVWGGVMTFFFIGSILLDYPIVWNFNPTTFLMLFLISFFILPLQTTCEEVLFRGYLFQGFTEFFKKGILSVLFTGILFGLMHGSNPEVEFYYFSIL